MMSYEATTSTHRPSFLGSGFSSLFNLPPTAFRDDVLEKLGHAMADVVSRGKSDIPSGYVYLGQFIAHDLSKLAPPPADISQPDYRAQLRDPRLNLDSVYGAGFRDIRIAVDSPSGKMILGPVVDRYGRRVSYNDLPRRSDKTAIIGDDRNDENLLIAQLHLQFLKLHNLFVDELASIDGEIDGESLFNEARKMVLQCYQEVVIYDFLKTLLDPCVWGYYFDRNAGSRQFIWNVRRCEAARMPIELAGAGLRFGHSMVLRSYSINVDERLNLEKLFAMTGAGNLDGNEVLPQTHVVNWRHFFRYPDRKSPLEFNLADAIDPFVHIVVPEQGPLAIKNLRTGNRLQLPDAQSIVEFIRNEYVQLARDIDLKVLTPTQLDVDADFNVEGRLKSRKLLSRLGDDYDLTIKTPLWYYLLAESLQQHSGMRMGRLASIIVAESIRALLTLSSPSAHDVIISKKVRRTVEFEGRKFFRMTDLLQAVERD